MKLINLTLAFFIALIMSGCFAQPNIKVEFGQGWRSDPFAPGGGPETAFDLNVVSTVNKKVVLKSILINDGNGCGKLYGFTPRNLNRESIPGELLYSVQLQCSRTEIKKVKIATNAGTFTFRFNEK